MRKRSTPRHRHLRTHAHRRLAFHPNDEQAIEEFRELVRERLGGLALAVLDLRLGGEAEIKSLIGADEFGRPTSYRIKKTVQQIKELAREFAAGRSPGFLSMLERAMASEQETLRKRFAASHQ